MILAKKLREKKYYDEIPNDKPGYYKWWSKKKELNELLIGLGVKIKDVEKEIEKQDELYCIYVGTATNQSLKKRLNLHLNKNSSVSTLRKSISSILFHKKNNKDGTNAYIDKLYVEWFPMKFTIKSEKAKSEILKIETKIINENLRILNINKNNHELSEAIKKNLRKLRKESIFKN